MTETEFKSKLIPLTPHEADAMTRGDKAISVGTGADHYDWGARIVTKGLIYQPDTRIPHPCKLAFVGGEISNFSLGRIYRKSDLREIDYNDVLQKREESTVLYHYSDELAEYISLNYKDNSFYRRKLMKKLQQAKKELDSMDRQDLMSLVENKLKLRWRI